MVITRILRACAALAAILLLTVAGCAPGTGDTSVRDGPPGEDATQAADAAVRVADTALGPTVVDAKGMTAYLFTEDDPGSGTSNCTGDCLAAWPPITTDSAQVTGDGITGELGTIELPDGRLQVTLEGWPLYTYVKDSAGDITGHEVDNVWFAIAPDGSQLGGADQGRTGY